ncbi:MAG: hypothetical protein WDN24_01120 [Sphingomonas sp.]
MDRNTPSRTPLAGGFLVAVGVLAGTVIGVAKGQPTIGFLGGLGVGLVLLAAVWAVDRMRR